MPPLLLERRPPRAPVEELPRPPRRSTAGRLAWLAVAATALAGLVCVLAGPATADMAAQTYRTGLWEREGFAVWNAAWYGGHHVPGYSLLFPPLAALLSPPVVGALAAVAACALFVGIARRHAPRPAAAAAAAWLFASGVVCNVVIGRMPFTLGVALGVAAWACAERAGRVRGTAAAVLAAATTAASPVAGIFLVTAAGALLPASWRRAALLVAPAVAAGFVPLVLFPEGGTERFVASAFWPMLAVCVAAWLLLDRRRRGVRLGAAIYLALLVLAFTTPNPLGQNAVRLGVLLGPALLVLAARPRAPRPALVVGIVALLYLQWLPAVRAITETRADPSVHAAFYDDAAAYLAPRLDPGQRVEVVFTRNHWEAAHLAPRVPLARGWERQLDRRFNGLFYEPGLTAARYEAWLRETGVRFVALPAAPLDLSARREGEIVRARPPFLELVRTTPRWQIFEVRNPAPTLTGPARMVAHSATGFVLEATAPGLVRLNEHHTPYWRVTAGRGCVVNAGGRTAVEVRRPGRIAVSAVFGRRSDRSCR
jgi:hypothetical protein